MKKSFFPDKLKKELYLRLIPDYNQIDKDFYQYIKKIDSRMPKYMQDLVVCNVKTIFCTLNYFDSTLDDMVTDILNLFYNYRPDIGYK